MGKINDRVGTSARVGKGNAKNLIVHYLGIKGRHTTVQV